MGVFRSIRMQLLLAFFFLYSAYAQSTGGCCTPRAWEGEITGYGAKINISFFETVSYDYENLRARVDIFTDRNRQFHQLTVFEETDRRSGTNYLFIVDHQKGTCETRTQPEPLREACIKENYHQERRVIIGGRLHATWYGYFNNGRENMMIAAHDRHNGGAEHHCIPIEGAFFDHHDRHYTFEAKVSFWNIHLGIGNPIVFEVPHLCKR